MSKNELMKVMARQMTQEVLKGIAVIMRGLISQVEPGVPGGEWWQKPGLGIQFQIEYRPGWRWSRDFKEFNRSMMDAEGRLVFNGPFCRIDEWVRLSGEAAVDYHLMEIKWHDGICYFDTKQTDWKTETDYARQFAEASRAAGIPFMYYYSSIFDHNPQFDLIQQSQSTISFIGMPGNPTYDEYIRAQYREIVEQYRPDGMWIDWYWPDQATKTTIEVFREDFPAVVLTFNASNIFPSSYSRLDYTSSEAHELDGPYVRVVKEEGGFVVVCKSAWKWAALERRAQSHPWELITPAGKWWQDPSLRDDPYDLVRMAAIIMASGGRLCMGVTAQMDGTIYPDQVEQLRILGRWYGPRRGLFADSVPLRYRRREPPGVKVSPRSVKAVACRRGGDLVLHLINMDGATRPIRLELRGKPWDGVKSAFLEPSGEELEIAGDAALIKSENVDPVDTIIRLN